MTWIDAVGWLAAALTLAAYSVRTMVPLRAIAVCANLSFISYGAAIQVYPMLILHLCLLPLNVGRLAQILRDRKRAAARTTEGALGVLRHHMRALTVPAGTHVFRQGDLGDKVYLIETGEVRLEELDVTLGPGELLGEMAFFIDTGARTASALCMTECRLLAADERAFIAAYYQDPALGLFITRVIARRLHDDRRRRADTRG